MAKKTAPKKKVEVKKSTAKPTKPLSKSVAKPATKLTAKTPAKVTAKAPAKAAPAKKAEVKPAKAVKPVAKAAAPKKAEPALMTKKGKAKPEVEVEEKAPPKAQQTVISMMEESATSEEPSKAEKVSKVKPVKIERGNLADEKAKWAELYKKYGKDKAATYKMSDTFTTMLPIQHKVLGWGFVLTNENDRLEVLFETGIRMLISNYKA